MKGDPNPRGKMQLPRRGSRRPPDQLPRTGIFIRGSSPLCSVERAWGAARGDGRGVGGIRRAVMRSRLAFSPHETLPLRRRFQYRRPKSMWRSLAREPRCSRCSGRGCPRRNRTARTGQLASPGRLAQPDGSEQGGIAAASPGGTTGNTKDAGGEQAKRHVVAARADQPWRSRSGSLRQRAAPPRGALRRLRGDRCGRHRHRRLRRRRRRR